MSSPDLVRRYDRRVPRYTSYPTAPHFTPAVTADSCADWLSALPDNVPLSLYLHVPFCDRLCLYCGCNTFVVRQEAPRRSYAALLEDELQMVAACVGRGRDVTQVHWGGGTPTTLPADCLVGIMALIRGLFTLGRDAEVAIEIDPTSLPPDRLGALADMKITRASLGVQDLDPAVQHAIGRVQSYEATADCAASLRAMDIASLNLDLIYGLPKQTVETVTRTARQALALQADRVAVFGYAHVPWMKRHQALIAEASLPDAPSRFAQLRAIADVLEHEGGYRPVGLDHYARPGDAMAEAAGSGQLRRSFQGYTTDAAPALVGIGASAIGCLPQGYVQNAPTVPAYAQAIRGGRLATVGGVALSADDRLRREVIERLMCDLQVDLAAVATAHRANGGPLLVAADGLAGFSQDGLVRLEGSKVIVTEAGRPFVRTVAAMFDAYLAPDDAKPKHASAI
jgi:oxygen-independent coproporphyrinogen-3 oxidase